MADQPCHLLSKVQQLSIVQAILASWSHQTKQPLAPACPKDAGEAWGGLKWGTLPTNLISAVIITCATVETKQGCREHSPCRIHSALSLSLKQTAGSPG